ncbi:hypothetical protein BJ742DRAFT_733700 [Cladochytrium replicatum]|nr:hypothetical protein BJ742DRAFT_733700 [Cladochytrium replicatum]
MLEKETKEELLLRFYEASIQPPGIGMDNPDIRFVIKSDVLTMIEEFWQEIGRGGQDHKLANKPRNEDGATGAQNDKRTSSVVSYLSAQKQPGNERQPLNKVRRGKPRRCAKKRKLQPDTKENCDIQSPTQSKINNYPVSTSTALVPPFLKKFQLHLFPTNSLCLLRATHHLYHTHL